MFLSSPTMEWPGKPPLITNKLASVSSCEQLLQLTILAGYSKGSEPFQSTVALLHMLVAMVTGVAGGGVKGESAANPSLVSPASDLQNLPDKDSSVAGGLYQQSYFSKTFLKLLDCCLQLHHTLSHWVLYP